MSYHIVNRPVLGNLGSLSRSIFSEDIGQQSQDEQATSILSHLSVQRRFRFGTKMTIMGPTSQLTIFALPGVTLLDAIYEALLSRQ